MTTRNGGEFARVRLARPLLAAVAAVMVGTGLLATGCHEAPPDILFESPLTTFFTESSTPDAPDLVRLRGEVIDNQTVLVEVVVTGPTTSSDIYSFAFDLLFSGDLTPQYVSGSAEAGDFLTAGPGQDVVAQVSQSGARLTVGVTKTGGGPGNGLGAGQATVVSFRVTLPEAGRAAIRFAADPQGRAPAALDPSGNPVPSIVFDGEPAVITRQA